MRGASDSTRWRPPRFLRLRRATSRMWIGRGIATVGVFAAVSFIRLAAGGSAAALPFTPATADPLKRRLRTPPWRGFVFCVPPANDATLLSIGLDDPIPDEHDKSAGPHRVSALGQSLSSGYTKIRNCHLERDRGAQSSRSGDRVEPSGIVPGRA